jgi:hypothetical protein
MAKDAEVQESNGRISPSKSAVIRKSTQRHAVRDDVASWPRAEGIPVRAGKEHVHQPVPISQPQQRRRLEARDRVMREHKRNVEHGSERYGGIYCMRVHHVEGRLEVLLDSVDNLSRLEIAIKPLVAHAAAHERSHL